MEYPATVQIHAGSAVQACYLIQQSQCVYATYTSNSCNNCDVILTSSICYLGKKPSSNEHSLQLPLRLLIINACVHTTPKGARRKFSTDAK